VTATTTAGQMFNGASANGGGTGTGLANGCRHTRLAQGTEGPLYISDGVKGRIWRVIHVRAGTR
jgi:hypothetical protein